MKTKVYSAFPGVGKTTYFNTTDRNVLDSDSSKFDKKHFPDNYIQHIERNIQDPKVDKILVSSHKDEDGPKLAGPKVILTGPAEKAVVPNKATLVADSKCSLNLESTPS